MVQGIIEQYHPAVIQIATQTGTGTGFYIKEFDVIVTNDHVVHDNADVTIAGKTFDKMISRVWYTDRKHDLAFIQPPSVELPEIRLGNYDPLKDGDEVLAIGHPYGFKYSATQGVISKVDRVREGVKYIQIDAAINPGNSGGPLVNSAGEVIGVNSFKIQGGENMGFALPVNYLRQALQLYAPHKGVTATRCHSCDFLVLPDNIDAKKYCPNCGTEVLLPVLPEKEAESMGIAKIIEEVLSDLGKNARLAREGVNEWVIKEGKVKILINYNTENYFLVSDAYLCQLPQDALKIKPLYQFLLQENYRLNGLVLSCQNQNIILSCLVYDQDFTRENGVKRFDSLLKNAHYYDELLKKEYGGIDNLDDE